MSKYNHKTLRICLSPGALGNGGIGRNVLNLTNVFLNKGFEVDLVFNSKFHYEREKEIPQSANIFELGDRTRYVLPATIKYLRKRRPDILISSHNNVSAMNLMAHRLSGVGKKCRIVCTFDTYRSIQLKSLSAQGRLYDWFAFRLYKFADKLVAVSKGVAKDIEETCGFMNGTVKTIYNPAWSSEMEQKAMEKCDEPWLSEKKMPVIISAGRLSNEKNFQLLLRAFSRLIQIQRAKLIILGEGEKRSELENFISKNNLNRFVKLPGHVQNPLTYMAKADLFVLSSNWEGFGNVIVEALGCGLPVISTDCPCGPREILEDGKYGILVPVGDHEKLAQAMEIVLSNPPPSSQQRQAALKFTFEICANSFLELFQDEFEISAL